VTVPELRTERLLMRGWRADDLDAWAELSADDEVMRSLGRNAGLSREDAWREMAYLAGHWLLRGFGQWVLEETQSGTLVGRAGLYFPEGWPGLEVGWTIARPCWGRGYAPEAGAAAMAWARDALGTDRLISLIADDNERSQRVAAKLGMVLEGRAQVRGQDLRVYGRKLAGIPAPDPGSHLT
jgi:RimJ/RimL family protein N-acetyltransferase